MKNFIKVILYFIYVVLDQKREKGRKLYKFVYGFNNIVQNIQTKMQSRAYDSNKDNGHQIFYNFPCSVKKSRRHN